MTQLASGEGGTFSVAWQVEGKEMKCAETPSQEGATSAALPPVPPVPPGRMSLEHHCAEQHSVRRCQDCGSAEGGLGQQAGR